ncbi:M23 family metallopeptidase [Mucilaginibacter sabulilitoris]|uniref:M23 family metallopeptidase n=1 Tax=Mucilaginibacter sabulilitoris TaxID=1173583 RepID=A0ABZ0TWL4_9SPHI|nr:M23 family metallopeptidase [Mucilaginibacter sabulilitoris]WPU96453.1 M23 family metallopeptidase [Mucilaginibacter sabulilitoris]
MKLFCCCLLALPLRYLVLTSGYGYRVHPVTGRFCFHSGIDLRARHDTVFAVMPGRIAFTGYDRVTGVYIRLASRDFTLLYGHLSQVFVLAGDSVNSGTPLGITGSSGRVTGEHLHFSASYRQVPVNPLLFLRGLMNNQLTNK